MRPPLLRSVIDELLTSQADIDLVPAGEAGAGRAGAFAGAVDVLIVSEEPGEADGLPERFLFASPYARVLALGPDGRSCALVKLRPQRTPLETPSPDSLLRAIRAAAASGLSR